MLMSVARVWRTSLFAGVLALGSSIASADTYQLTQDHCTSGCNPGSPGTSMGIITVQQNGANDVEITVDLLSQLELVNTGLQNTIDFNIVGAPTIALASVSNSKFSLSNTTAGLNHFDGFGSFEYSLQLNTSQGAGGAVAGPLTFDITCASCNLMAADFNTTGTHANTTFGVDVYNKVNGNTGPIGAGSVSVPEPASAAILGVDLLSALAGILLVRRYRARRT